MRRTNLTRQEQRFEDEIEKGEWTPVNKKEFEEIAQAIARKRKDAVLNVRVNKQDLDSIKDKARKLGVRYQTFIGEILHKVATL